MPTMEPDSEDDLPVQVEAMRSGVKYNNSTDSSMEPITSHGPSAPLSPRQTSFADSDHEYPVPRSAPQPISAQPSKANRSILEDYAHPRPLPTPGRSAASIPPNLLPSAPASPPTPAPSPGPHSRAPNWTFAGENEVGFLRESTRYFEHLDSSQRERFLGELLNMCNNQQLVFVHNFVAPKLKKDPFLHLPNELCLRVLSFVDDPITLARAAQVSKRWRELLNDDLTWKRLCDKHAYRRMSNEALDAVEPLSLPQPARGPYGYSTKSPKRGLEATVTGPSASAPNLTTSTLSSASSSPRIKRRPKTTSYRSHFKQKYMVEAAWRKGGESIIKHITPDQGVVTSLHLTEKYIVVALDNAKIHVFNTVGDHQRTLQGHVMGVWAMVPWGDMLVSGGCDRDVRVWNMATGASVHTLRGHTSTVRCLKMADANTAISGSRDTTLRIWDLRTGVCKNVLVGHQASVRCLGIHGDIVVSGSYDTTARIWSISEGRCLRTLTGHFSQIYAIAFDGSKIATGSLDTSVRIWDPNTGACNAILQGHTSLVGQLQMRGDTLVSGGSDGSVRVWSLSAGAPVHRLAAHDNSVTSLQFDDVRIVSGGSDGRVKIWSLKTGQLVRELSQPAESVWRVAFEEEKCVIMASRANRTVMEVWSFSPPDEHPMLRDPSSSPVSMPDHHLSLPSDAESDRNDGDSTMHDADNYIRETGLT